MIQLTDDNASKIIKDILYRDLEKDAINIAKKFSLDLSEIKSLLLNVLNITILTKTSNNRPFTKNKIKELLDGENMLNPMNSQFDELNKIDAKEVIDVVESISDIELEIDSVDYDSDEFDINLDESKFNPIDNDEEVEIECVKTNINGTEYYWNNQTNDLYDLNEKLIGKIMGNGKIVYKDTT